MIHFFHLFFFNFLAVGPNIDFSITSSSFQWTAGEVGNLGKSIIYNIILAQKKLCEDIKVFEACRVLYTQFYMPNVVVGGNHLLFQ